MPLRKIFRQIREISDPRERFRQLCLLYCWYLAESGVGVRPFIDPELTEFSPLTEETKTRILRQIEQAVEIFEEMHDEGLELQDTPKLLWRALLKFGWVPQSDAFDKFEGSDVICIFSENKKLVFQNLHFFDYSSLSLEQLLVNGWLQYTRREPEIEEQFSYHLRELGSGRVHRTLSSGIPEHSIEEVGTEEQLKFRARVRYISPLRGTPRRSGALVFYRFGLQ